MTPNEAFLADTPDMNLEWGPVEIDLKPGHFIDTAIRSEEMFELQALAKDKDVMEVGTAHGYSAIMMALAGARIVYSIDDHNGQTQLGDTLASLTGNLQACGVREKVVIMVGDATPIMVDMIRDMRGFDLVFLDGALDFTQLILDIRLGVELVRKGGVLAIHDYGHITYPDKKKAVDYFYPKGPDKLVTSLWIKQL